MQNRYTGDAKHQHKLNKPGLYVKNKYNCQYYNHNYQ